MTDEGLPEGFSDEVPDDHPLVETHDEGKVADAAHTVTLTGLFKKVDAGRHRVYLTGDLGSYAEYNADQYVGSQVVPAASSPIPGVEARRVILKRGAQVDFTYRQRSSISAHDQVDLDVRSELAYGTGHAEHCADYTIVKSTRLCTYTIYGYGLPTTRLCQYTIHPYGPPPPASTVTCRIATTKYTI